MASVRQVAGCLGLPARFSIVRNFFGYASPPPWNTANSQVSLPQSLSLLTQVKRVQKRHFHLDLIRVGTNPNGRLPAVDEENLDCAVQWARDIFAPAGLGIGRVIRWWLIPLSDNTGYDDIEDACEAEDLVDEFNAPGGGIDVFFVLNISDTFVGIFPSKSDGVVVESRGGTFLGTARTFAHEIGHFLGLGHENGRPSNLMCQSIFANPMPSSILLDSEQSEDIRDHDDTKSAC